ncbi:MAG: ATP synthase subunit I [Methylophilus sp.]|uniref:ATP synthase subunit I n=1 Tax=Methylophilus sp. TaxID=29541 RepID=UPI003F9F5AC0
MTTPETSLSDAQMYRNMLRWQVMATAVVTIAAGLISGLPAGISALFGGVAVIVGAWFAARIAARSQSKTQATDVLLNLLKAEAVKILIIAIILLAVFKLYQSLVPFALIAGLAAAALFSGAALAKSQTPV